VGLVFDIGAHEGEDTGFYLHQGHRVVAVDADPEMAAALSTRFAAAIESGRLVVLDRAVSDRDGSSLAFHRSTSSIWSSARREIADRSGTHRDTIDVPTTTLAALIAEHGVPDYCKIDIEGLDVVALRSLHGAPVLPTYVSVETECVAEGDDPAGHDPLATLKALRDAGYERYKLVDQRSLAVLSPRVRSYRRYESRWRRRLRARLKPLTRRLFPIDESAGYAIDPAVVARRRLLGRRHGYEFPLGASGPYGDALAGEWVPFDVAADMLLVHRDDYFAMSDAWSFGFWCDWHARAG
jgi:FkbM family methyltransferase